MTCALQVYIYHGPDRNSSVPFLEQHDIVTTTYSILTGERSMRSGLLKVRHAAHIPAAQLHLPVDSKGAARPALGEPCQLGMVSD